MKDFYFEKDSDISEFTNIGINDLVINELLILEFSNQIEKIKIQKLLSLVTAKSSRAYVKLSYYDKNFNELISEFSKWGISKFCIKLDLKENTEVALGTARVQPPIIRSKTANEVKKILNTFLNFELSFELLLNEENINDFYSIVAYLSETKLPWALVNPQNIKFEKNAEILKNAFELLRMNAKTNTKIYFTQSHPLSESWNARTGNLLGGPQYVDIDVSNSCTHNCVFCGLYAEEAVERFKKYGGGTLPKVEREKMAAKIDRLNCLDFINSLPDSVQNIQFGGVGDPFTHRNILEFIAAARERNVNVSCLTNFSYMNHEMMNRLHSLSGKTIEALSFIVNISAANSKTYQAIRPNQKEKDFENVVESLKYSQDLRSADPNGKGVSLYLMSVTNKLNFRDMPEFAALTKYIGAEFLWIKPIEVHGDEVIKYLISDEEQFEYARYAKMLLHVAEKINVQIFMPEVLQIIVDKYADQLKKYELNHPITKQIEAIAEHSELLRRFYINKEENLSPRDPADNPRRHYYKTYNNLPNAVPTVIPRTDLPKDGLLDLGVVNADLQRDYYDYLPCKVGYNYFRVEVQGSALPCCISNITIGNIKEKSFSDLWLSDSLNVFRSKMERIHKERFHRKDKEWVFCQQCPHLWINTRHNAHAGYKLEGS